MSSKGQVVLPEAVRTRYQIQVGDPLEIVMERDRVILVPPKRKKRKGRIVIDPKTGMAAVTFGPGAPVITSEWVAKMLEDFP
jgi:AbrB family looped-hinge helix DNA binding protein